jgi:hypothetical protein
MTMTVGDLVRYLDEEVLDVGVVVRIYSTLTGELEQSIDVLWDDGVWTSRIDHVEVISAAG